MKYDYHFLIEHLLTLAERIMQVLQKLILIALKCRNVLKSHYMPIKNISPQVSSGHGTSIQHWDFWKVFQQTPLPAKWKQLEFLKILCRKQMSWKNLGCLYFSQVILATVWLVPRKKKTLCHFPLPDLSNPPLMRVLDCRRTFIGNSARYFSNVPLLESWTLGFLKQQFSRCSSQVCWEHTFIHCL